MTEEKKEQVIENIANMLRTTTFTFEFKVKKKPKGIRVICEVTQETMDALLRNAEEKNKKED